jgi:hypothetical protein
MAAVVAAGVIITAGASSLLGERPTGPWATGPGASLKAGFMNGCRASGPDRYCGCLFESISSVPPYDTPNGFATLQYAVERAKSGDQSAIPQVLVDAVHTCKG